MTRITEASTSTPLLNFYELEQTETLSNNSFDTDVFEVSEISTPGFNTEEARSICDDEEIIQIMQEIDQHNCYVFKRTPHIYTLNQTLQALGMAGTIEVSRGTEKQQLSSFQDLSIWWQAEKLIRGL